MTNELYHHGIKGMHWGIRRTPEQLGYRHATKNSKTKERLKDIKDKTYKKFTNTLNKVNSFKNDIKEKVEDVKVSTAMKVQNFLDNEIFNDSLQTHMRNVEEHQRVSDEALRIHLSNTQEFERQNQINNIVNQATQDTINQQNMNNLAIQQQMQTQMMFHHTFF